MGTIILEQQKVKDIVLLKIDKTAGNLQEVQTYTKKIKLSLTNQTPSSVVYNLGKITHKISSIETQLSITRKYLVEKLDTANKIDLKSKQKIRNLSNSIILSANSIINSIQNATKTPQEATLTEKLQVKTNQQKNSVIRSIQETLTRSIMAVSARAGIITGNTNTTGTGAIVRSAARPGTIAGLTALPITIVQQLFQPNKTESFAERIHKTKTRMLETVIEKYSNDICAINDIYSIEELITAINRINYGTDIQKSKTEHRLQAPYNYTLPFTQIQVNGNVYAFQNGKCVGISFRNGIVANITYSNNQIINIKTKYSGEPPNIDIFGTYNQLNGQFGGDQSSLSENVDKLLQDPIVLNMLRAAYPGKELENYQRYLKMSEESNSVLNDIIDYFSSDKSFEKKYGFPREYLEKNYSIEQVKQLSSKRTLEDYELYLKKITNTGCGYTAVINTIFKEYEGREEAFQRKFGYPMYTLKTNGTIDFNYEYLIIDLFTEVWKNGTYSFDDIIAGMEISSGIDAAISGETSQLKTGTNAEIVKKIERSFEIKYNFDVDMYTYYDYPYSGMTKTEFINDILPYEITENNKKNRHTILIAEGYDLYTMDEKLYYENGGSHAMYITGQTDDGEIIVSTWGKDLIVKLDNITYGGTIQIEYNWEDIQ